MRGRQIPPLDFRYFAPALKSDNGLTAKQSARYYISSNNDTNLEAQPLKPRPQAFCGGGAAHAHVLLSMFLSRMVNDRAGENVCAAAFPCLNA